MTPFEVMVTEARATADRRASLVPLARLKETSRLVPGAVNTLSSLRTDGWAITVIAEVKRSTATFADLSGVGDPGMLACFYAAGGAACASVVAEPNATRGFLKDLDAVRASVGLPVLTNDLMVTPYQMHKAQAHSADLLILDAHLETLVLEGLTEKVHSLGMDVVVGVRTRHEALTAIDAGACIMAIDARDPDTLAVDCSLFDQVTGVLPMQVVRIVAGGVGGPHDVMNFVRCGTDVVLIGEAIIRSTGPRQLITELVTAGAHPALIPSTHREVL